LGQTSLTVDAATFASQMAYLAKTGYNTISADQLAQALVGHQKLGKTAVLTFDDGYADFYTYAYPILQQHHFIANLMIPTGLIQNSDYLTWSQLASMVSSGQVFAYDHTWSHKSLGAAPADVISKEVLTARSQLQANLGKTVDIFTYPYGSESPNVINFLRQNGFIAAFSTIPGQIQCDSFIMTLHRTRVGNSALSAYGI
jgi:peptidoglycan/xylan/chitin deacetylase (PgdA/CDA1 family)